MSPILVPEFKQNCSMFSGLSRYFWRLNCSLQYIFDRCYNLPLRTLAASTVSETKRRHAVTISRQNMTSTIILPLAVGRIYTIFATGTFDETLDYPVHSRRGLQITTGCVRSSQHEVFGLRFSQPNCAVPYIRSVRAR